jgi:hypothetical protein
MTLADIAAIAALYDTAMSRAMMLALAALGVDVPKRRRRSPAARHDQRPDKDVVWCMRDWRSPMDLLS